MYPPKDQVIVALLKDDKTAYETSVEKGRRRTPDPMVLELLGRGEGVGDQGRQQDGSGLDQWQGKARCGRRGSWECPETIAGMVGHGRRCTFS